MRSLFLVVFLSFLSWAALAQPKGYSSVKDVAAFSTGLSKANASRATISSDFTQTKNLTLLSDKIKSKGTFAFKKDDKVRLEYTAPYKYLLVMNSGQIMVKDEQKTSRINTKGSKTLQSVNDIMINCMRGTVLAQKDFKVTAYENGSLYLLTMIPAEAGLKKMFRQIDVYLDKKSFNVERLTMTEQGGDFTDMDFTNTRHNLPLADALFKVK